MTIIRDLSPDAFLARAYRQIAVDLAVALSKRGDLSGQEHTMLDRLTALDESGRWTEPL